MLDPNKIDDLKSIEKCRKIAREVIDFGVNEKEIIKLIGILSLELEDISLMKRIHSLFNEEKINDSKDIKKEKIIIWKEIKCLIMLIV